MAVESSSTITKPKASLLTIPAELRNRIWELALSVKGPSDGNIYIRRLWRHKDPPSVLRLLQTCRQIYSEAKGIFYHVNSLWFTDEYALEKFANSTGPARTSHLRSLRLDCTSLRLRPSKAKKLSSTLLDFKQLKILHVTMCSFSVEDSNIIRKALSHLRGLSELRIKGYMCCKQAKLRMATLEKELQGLVLQPRDDA